MSQYISIQHFAASQHVRLVGKFASPWRLTPPFVGWIHGLTDATYGTLVATNGIDCYIEKSDGTLFLGHLDWFVKDPAHRAQPSVSLDTDLRRRSNPAVRSARMIAMMEEYK